MVLWRDGDGAARQRRVLPHLGAHFGYGGHVNGNDIVCPFHGWRFDCDGPQPPSSPLGRTSKKACEAVPVRGGQRPDRPGTTRGG